MRPAQHLIGIARPLYASEPIGLELKEAVYAFDATTIDPCLSVYPWAPFRSTKAAIKLHTLLDVHGSIPSFIHISAGKTHEVNVLDALTPEPGALYLLDRGYMDFARLHALHEAGSFFLIRAKRGLRVKRATRTRWTGSTRGYCAIRRSRWRSSTPSRATPPRCAAWWSETTMASASRS